MKSLSAAIGLAAALAAAPALAGQKFCAPEGTLAIDQGVANFTPSDPADKAQVMVAKVETKSGRALIVATRNGEGVAFMPDERDHYAVDYDFPQAKWSGWSVCS